MEDSLALKLRQLLAGRSVAALGTLHAGAPYVSMVPFALLEDASAFVIHVSRLAEHTKNMEADPRVSLLVMEPEQPGVSAQALPRATVLGQAHQLAANSADHARARAVYLKRFPSSAPMFEFGDFSLFTITPDTIRWVAGFAQALSLTPASFAKAIRGGE